MSLSPPLPTTTTTTTEVSPSLSRESPGGRRVSLPEVAVAVEEIRRFREEIYNPYHSEEEQDQQARQQRRRLQERERERESHPMEESYYGRNRILAFTPWIQIFIAFLSGVVVRESLRWLNSLGSILFYYMLVMEFMQTIPAVVVAIREIRRELADEYNEDNIPKIIVG